MAEVFKQTHTLKENKEMWVDKGSSDFWDEYTINTAIATKWVAKFGSSALVDPEEVLCQTVSEPNAKNRIYGVGGFLVSTLKTSVFATQASSISATSAAPVGQEE
ncbi:hypothetical protein PIB30_088881 [Stylosanthes scabra]|uniref:Uncharacterized protein n=1 Tax=Stylosanthes scabra TaxID=79078 RepID=A0ABU6WS59_9FABA|nr:hypothetical protein [Stylosanthes scabra]